MTGPVFVKRYRDPDRVAAARAHRDWLAGLECGVRLPALRSADLHQLVFEHLDYQQPGPGDLGLLAQALDLLHAAAYTRQLHAARLDEQFPTSDGLAISVSIVDFDDLTLAPFGYDLAKLVVSTAMTHGHLDPREVDVALKIYNTHTASGSPTTCAPEQLRVYAEFHHLLTERYLHRNGYSHAWPELRSWREPEVPR